MQIKVLKNKKFCIPMETIKDAKRGAEEEEQLVKRIENMTDEEYEAYVEEELAEADLQIKSGQYMSEEQFIKEINEHMQLLEKEEKNYQNWKKLLEINRREKILRNIL